MPAKRSHPRCLATAGPAILDYDELDKAQKKALRAYVRDSVVPILTPLAVDSEHPFPFISNLGLNLAVVLPDTNGGRNRFVRIKIPDNRTRWVPLPHGAGFTPLEQAIARGLAYAPLADLIWCETSVPNLEDAKRFAEAMQAEHPDQLLAYNCSPSFNWKANLDDATIATFQRELGAMGYKFQFVTLAGFHALNNSMFELATGYLFKFRHHLLKLSGD